MRLDKPEDIQPVLLAFAGAALGIAPREEFAGERVFHTGDPHEDAVDIGGDWYSVIPVDGAQFAFVVGDVSGRGISAASVMARRRFTMRAYLIEGHSPDDVLEMCSRQFSIVRDHHLATALVGLGNLHTREITLASAGHLSPLMVDSGRAEFIPTSVGLPLGLPHPPIDPSP